MNKYLTTFSVVVLAMGSLAAHEAPRSRKSMPTPTLRRAVRDVQPLKKQEKVEEKKDSNRSTAAGDRWQDDFSREPMWFIQCSIGTSNDPQGRGRAPWWYRADGVDWLVNEIRTAYGFGARRFWINRPMGAVDHLGKAVPAASWLTIEPERRGEMVTKLNNLLLDECPDAELYWYIGSDMSDPRVFSGGSRGTTPAFFGLGDTSTHKRLIATRDTIGGWLSTGAAGLGLDYSGLSEKKQDTIALAEALRGAPFHFSIIGEAIPYTRVGSGYLPDEEAVKDMPWVSTTSVIDERFADSVVFDRDETRTFAWFEAEGSVYGNPHERLERVDHYMDLGYIVITCDRAMFLEALNRARQTGEIDR